MSTELLTALICMIPCVTVGVVVFGVLIGLNSRKHNTRRVAEQTAVLEQVGLSASGSRDWRVGTVAGRPVSATSFEQHYYVDAGKPPVNVPEAVREGLLAWALDAPTDSVEMAPRASSHLYAGRQFPRASTLVRVESRHPRLDPEDLQAWLTSCVERVAAMEPGA